MTDLELAYLAGFFDGEGSIGVYRRNRDDDIHKLVISVTNLDPRPLRSFERRWGGRVRSRSRSHRGSRNRTIHEWILSDLVLQKTFLADILPLVVAKYSQVQLAIGFTSLVGTDRTRLPDSVRAEHVRIGSEMKRLKWEPNQ